MVEPASSSVPPTTEEHVHEETDVAIRPLAIFLISLVVALGLVAVLMIGMFNWYLSTTNVQSDVIPVITPPEEEFTAPPLQVSARQDLQLFRAKEDQQLRSTEWVDRQQGIVRIPIYEAIRIVSEQGFPDWPKMDVVLQQTATEQPSVTPADSEDEGAP